MVQEQRCRHSKKLTIIKYRTKLQLQSTRMNNNRGTNGMIIQTIPQLRTKDMLLLYPSNKYSISSLLVSLHENKVMWTGLEETGEGKMNKF